MGVLIVDAGRVGAGASGRSGGIVLEDTAAGALDGVTGCVPHLERFVGERGIECDLRIGGCWELAHKPGSEQGAPGWSDDGKRLVVHDLVPGGTLDPTALLAGMVDAFLGMGGSIAERTPIQGIHAGPHVTLELSEGRILTEHVVLALNAFTRTLIPESRSIHPALTLALCTGPLSPDALEAVGLGRGLPFYTVDLPYLWGRVLPDRRIIFGGGLAFDPGDDVSRIDLGSTEVVSSLAKLEGRVRRFHSALSEVPIPTQWGGPVAFRPSRRPLLYRLPTAPRVIVTGSYAGHGVALAVRVGDLLAESLVEDRDLPAWGRTEEESEGGV
jgi:glycine/D-amino acid oxidase-like deaminating enzyme